MPCNLFRLIAKLVHRHSVERLNADPPNENPRAMVYQWFQRHLAPDNAVIRVCPKAGQDGVITKTKFDQMVADAAAADGGETVLR